jgi:hypothetical protein
MVGLVTQSGQKQFAPASQTDIAKVGFGQAVQNQPVLVAGKVTKAKEVEYKFPYQTNELIGVFGDRGQYRVTAADDRWELEKSPHPENRLDPKDAKPTIKFGVYVNGVRVNDVKTYTQPNKQQVILAVKQAVAKNELTWVGKHFDLKQIALPVGTRGDGQGKHILSHKITFNMQEKSFFGIGNDKGKGTISNGIYNLGTLRSATNDFERDGNVIKTLNQAVAARGGVPFRDIRITNVSKEQIGYSRLTSEDNGQYPNASSMSYILAGLTGRYDLSSDIEKTSILKEGGSLTISMKKGSRDLTYAKFDQGYGDLNEINGLLISARKSKTTLNVNIGDKHYTFKPNGTAWLNGVQIVTSTLMRDQNKK